MTATGTDTQPDAARRYAIGLDIGGTFTDVVLLDERGGTMRVHKLLTTPDDPARAAIDGVREIIEQAGLPIGSVGLLIHSTTLVTNALIERKGAAVGLLTTAGFRDVLEMRDEHRYDIYDLFLDWPAPLVPRQRRLPIRERVTRDGDVLAAPDEAEIAEAVDRLVADGIEALAVSFLHAYKRPAHEQLVAEIAARRHPSLPVTLSSDVAPVIREYERTATAVADAYIRPLTRAYLSRMEAGLAEIGYRGRFYLMLSGGGSASVASARAYPIRLVESGPAAGALAAALYGRLTERDPILSFDMGGTTAKACVVEGGTPTVVNVLEVARAHRFKSGSGMPVVIPSVELLEIGAGGGSIARLDAMGLLKVGPDSAGADPGPACYGRGGREPTVTDANLLLGYLDPSYFLGGRMRLDPAAAEAAVGRLAAASGLSVEATAWGIHQVVNENMAQAARAHLFERNADPRALSVVAFGGAGPAHAAAIARVLDIRRVVYPLGAGATSAVGCLAAPLAFPFTRSLPGLLDSLDWDAVNGLYADLEERGRATLAEADVPTEDVELIRAVDARIAGQIHELTIPVPSGVLGPATVPALKAAFAEAYRHLFTRYDESSVLETVNWKVTASGPERPIDPRHAAPERSGAEAARKGTRPACFGRGDRRETPVYDRYRLAPGSTIAGPAIVEEREATVILPPRSRATVDDSWNLILDLEPAEPGDAAEVGRTVGATASAGNGARA